MEKSVRKEAIRQLGIFAGKWELEVIHPRFPPNSIYGNTTFDWMESEMYMVQRTMIHQTEFPNSTMVFDYDTQTYAYVLHYFDSRGVTRLYNMSLENEVWKMWRDTADFSKLDFSQRFIGKFNEAENTIQSYWEKSYDGLNWEHDFKIIYRKVI